MMGQLTPLSNFFSAIENDPRISTTHIGIYAALLELWRKNNYLSPVHAFSYDIMRMTKISSRDTYLKVIRDLNDYGYIKYEVSFKRNKPSKYYLPTTSNR